MIKPSRERLQENAEEHIIEFEQALLSLQVIPNIANPCMKKTMMIAPKKFVGKVPNSQVHHHSNAKKTYTDFDTFHLVCAQS